MIHRPIVFLDVETTGGGRNARITDIGALRIENGEVVGTFNQLVNPETNIPKFITALTGITNQMAYGAPTFDVIADALEKFLDGAILAAHYLPFDYGMLQSEFSNIDKPFTTDRFCTVRLSRALYPAAKRHGLDQVIARLDVTVINRHRGFDDAEVLWKLFRKAMQNNPYRLFQLIDSILILERKQKKQINPNLMNNDGQLRLV